MCAYFQKMSWEQHKVSFVHNDLCLTLSAKLASYLRHVKGKHFEFHKAFRSLKHSCALCTYTVGIELSSLRELTLPVVLIFTIYLFPSSPTYCTYHSRISHICTLARCYCDCPTCSRFPLVGLSPVTRLRRAHWPTGLWKSSPRSKCGLGLFLS
jgi:hypothetical protein